MKVAVTGARGQLGSELCLQLGAAAVPLSRADFDLLDCDRMTRVLTDVSPNVLIHCAAYTAVDRAEHERDACRRVNNEAVGWLVDVCRSLDCSIVLISTDYVFGCDELRAQPYTEDDIAGPVNFYGDCKLAAEQHAVRWERHLIVRTSGLYSNAPGGPVRGRNFVDTMLSLAGGRDELRVVSDQYCTPSYVPHVATAILSLVHKSRSGLYHISNTGSTNWHEFAQEIFRRAGSSQSCKPISTQEWGAIARRPRYSVLSTAKYHGLDEPRLPCWRQGLDAYFESAR